MKTKLISATEWWSIISPNSGTAFSTNSPIKALNSSPHFAYAWAGVPSCVSGQSIPVGTVDASRFGVDGRARIKTDEWLVYASDSRFLIQDVTDKRRIVDHHTDGTPSAFTNAPNEIRKLFRI
ncbi:hypothetical protein HYS00_01030 [Candidatus Microgenomates bacterium]|nr:hypothetical protein [Candidatus Microgenomates bacterium]